MDKKANGISVKEPEEVFITETTIKNLIYVIRGQQVILDSDLAMLYQVETKVFNQAVKRNEERFPKEFCFQLTREEYNDLRSQIVTSKGMRNSIRYLHTYQNMKKYRKKYFLKVRFTMRLVCWQN